MLSTLLKQKYPIILLVGGLVLIFLSVSSVEDLTQWKISVRSAPIYPIFICGIVIVLFSIILFALTESYLDWRFYSKVRTEKDGYSIRVERADLRVSFGQIEGCDASEPSCVVALPANEFFDDECINDERSALGAYIQRAFPDGVNAIRELIAKEVSGLPFENVEKEHARMQKSFGIAKCVYLKKPLGSARKILLISVTTKRKGEGLRSEPHYLFEAIDAIQRFMADSRLNELYVPVMGSGHGGMRNELALLYMVLAFSEVLRRRSAQHLRLVNIVVFQNNLSSEPQIPRRVVKRILAFVASRHL